MRKIRKRTSYSHRVFAAVLAAALLFTMPGMSSIAAVETTQTEDISESVTVQAEYDAAEKPEAENEVIQEPERGDSDTDKLETGEDDGGDTDAQKPAEEEPVPAQKEDTEVCTCGTLCAEDSINGDCPVCGAEDADLSRCKGEKTENKSEENKEDADAANVPAPIDEPTEESVAKVETSDGTIVYLDESDFAKVFDNYNYNNVTVTLLSDIQPGSIDMDGIQARVHIFNACTLDLAGYTITDSDTVIYVWPSGNFTIKDSSSGKTGQVISTGGAAILTQTGMVSLTGGTYTGNPTIDGKNSSANVSSLLANYGTQVTPHYAYFDAQGSPIALEENQRELTGTVTVRECTHQGNLQDNEDGTHGGNCSYCGAELAAVSHTLGEGNKCEGCGASLKVQVEIGNATTYYGGIDAAWEAVEGKTAIITLLANVTATTKLEMTGGNITFIGGDYTLTSTSIEYAVSVRSGTLTVESGTIYTNTNGAAGVKTFGGTLEVTGGKIEADYYGIMAQDGSVRISGGEVVSGYYGLARSATNADVKISGGKISGVVLNSGKVCELLLNYGTTTGTHYAFYQNGKPVDLTSLEDPSKLSGTVMVAECKHEGVKGTPNNDGTHSLNCPYCGYTEAANCSYGTEYKHDENSHWLTCTVCGYQKTEAHSWRFAENSTNNVVENYQECPDCHRTKDHLTLTITVPDGLTYGNTGGVRPSYMVSPDKTCDDVTWKWRNENGSWVDLDDGALPAGLPVGNHRLLVNGRMSDGTVVFLGTANFTVSPAPLTGEMVTLSTESVTYSGAEQKPTITVKQGDTMLAEGTDYDVTYSTTDFTNAGTVTITITGKGNYTGTVETTYTIKKAPLTITANEQTITYGKSIIQDAENVTIAGLCSGDVLESITLTASTANVPGGNITPSDAFIKNSGGMDVSGNYEITYNDGTLTINKADAEIKVGTDTYDKTFGDAAFTLDVTVTDINTEADIQYEVTGETDVLSVLKGTVTVKNAGTAAITLSLPETANYHAAKNKTITVNVAKKGGYTVSEINNSYYFDKQSTAKIDLAVLLPADCGAVSYGTPTIAGDVTYSAAPVVNDGELSYTVDRGSADEKGTITIVVTTRNYEDITVTVAITRSSCDHVVGTEILYTGEGEKAPTCTESGLGHRECTKCGSVMESGVLVSALGHDYVGEVTKEPTISAEGEKTYTCSRCGDTYTETIPKMQPEGLWVSGLEQSYSYTGSAIKPESIRVYHGSTLLREKTEYTLSYKNNTKAGTAQLIVTGKGSYKGKATAEFTIEAVDLSTDANISASVATATETGKNLKPTVTVTWNGKKLKEKTDYTLTYDANIKTASAEGYDVAISGKGNYTGSIVRKFRVAPRGTLLLNNAKVTGLAKSYPYQEGKEIPKGLEADLNKLSVKIGKTTLTKDTDYTLRVENGDTVGTGTIVLEAAPASAYAGEKRISFNVTGTDLKKCYITGLEKTYPYTGKPVKPEVRVYTGKNGTGMQIPSDAYTVQYSNYVNQGKAVITVTGKASKGCSGSIKATYTIGRLNLATEEKTGNITVTMPNDIKYAKGGARPQPVITHIDGIILREGVDYALKYSNNTSINGKTKPTLKITGTGNYCGTITKNFDIGAQDIGTLEITAADKAYNSKKKGSYYYSVPKVYDLDGKQLKSGKDYTVQYTSAATGSPIGKTDAVENGAQICVTVTGKGSYTGTMDTTYYVRDAKDVKDIAKAKYDKISAQQYTGSEIRPKVSLYILFGKTKNYLTQDDYEIIGYYNNVKKGTATILVRGTNTYSGVKSITFKITAADNKSIWSGIF